MDSKPSIRGIEPILPSQDIERDIQWHNEFTGFAYSFGDKMYAGVKRENQCIHLQWHADNESDPLLGGSVIKIFVHDIEPYVKEFIERGTIQVDKFQKNTPWGTHEFGFHDLNGNAIYFVQDI